MGLKNWLLADMLERLEHIELLIVNLSKSEAQRHMATLQNFKDLLNGVKTETDRIADKIDELVESLKAGGLSKEEEAQVFADLQAHSDRLKGIGADAADPVPNPLPAPPTV
jgi:hypothetical protein